MNHSKRRHSTSRNPAELARALVIGSIAILLAAAVPIFAQPGIPIGLYDIAVTTNCFQLDQPLRTPHSSYWQEPFPPPVFAPNQIRLHGRIVKSYDIANLFSTNPAIVQLPAHMELKEDGGAPYPRSTIFVSLNEPKNPTPVVINARSSKYPLTSNEASWNVIVYPRQTILSAVLRPNKNLYSVGDLVTAVIKLSWTSGLNTVEGVFHQPTYTRAGYGTNSADISAWAGSSTQETVRQQGGSREITFDFEIAFPDDPGLAAAQQLPLEVKTEIKGLSGNPCQLVKSPSERSISFTVENPNYQACPAGQIQVRTTSLPACTACIPTATERVANPGLCSLDTKFATPVQGHPLRIPIGRAPIRREKGPIQIGGTGGYCIPCAAQRSRPKRGG